VAFYAVSVLNRRILIPVGLVVALVVVDAAARFLRRDRAVPNAGSWLAEPYPLRPFAATSLDGRDVSTATWPGRVVVVNFWATWCVPCRREIPALAALQEKFVKDVLVIGILDDNVTPDAAMQFGRSLRMNYPVVPSTFEISQSFPPIEALPMTFLIDRRGRLLAVYAGEIDSTRLEADVQIALTR
jgi:thiol-disulfide isomerase/thioredoxin